MEYRTIRPMLHGRYIFWALQGLWSINFNEVKKWLISTPCRTASPASPAWAPRSEPNRLHRVEMSLFLSSFKPTCVNSLSPIESRIAFFRSALRIMRLESEEQTNQVFQNLEKNFYPRLSVWSPMGVNAAAPFLIINSKPRFQLIQLPWAVRHIEEWHPKYAMNGYHWYLTFKSP